MREVWRDSRCVAWSRGVRAGRNGVVVVIPTGEGSLLGQLTSFGGRLVGTRVTTVVFAPSAHRGRRMEVVRALCVTTELLVPKLTSQRPCKTRVGEILLGLARRVEEGVRIGPEWSRGWPGLLREVASMAGLEDALGKSVET